MKNSWLTASALALEAITSIAFGFAFVTLLLTLSGR